MNIALRNRKIVANTFLASIAAVLMITLSGCGVVSDLADIGTAGGAFITEMGKGNAAGAAELMHSNAGTAAALTPALQGIIDRKLSGMTVTGTKLENNIGTLTGTCKMADASGKIVDGELTVQTQKDGDTWKVNYFLCKIS